MNRKRENILKNNYKLKLIFSIFLMLTVSILVSYGAYVTIKQQSGENTLTSSCFDTSFIDSSVISLNNTVPKTDIEGLATKPYTFTITNNCNLATFYYVILSTTSDSFSNNYINYSYNNMDPITLSETKLNTLYSIDQNYSESYILNMGALKMNESNNIEIKIWINESTEYTPNMKWEGEIKVISVVAEHEATIFAKSDYNPDFGTDTSNANAPTLVENLIPVVYDDNLGEWIKASKEQNKWYNYDKQIWANAITVTDENRMMYEYAPAGSIIPMEEILGMYVWIPRYEYQYINLGTSYAGGTKTEPGAINIKFISNITTNETSNYIIHPAFRNGSITYTNNAYTTTEAYQMGGWDKELYGFWYGKFETTGTVDQPTILPSQKALRSQTGQKFFDISLNVSTNQGINLESHMSKNSEWGAVAYLSQSNYGKYGNQNYTGVNKEIFYNNAKNYYTGASLGEPSNSTNYKYSADGTYKYNETLGMGASTTGNVYGIYDMVGGTAEYILGIYTGKNSPTTDRKFYDHYTTNTSTACGGLICYGHALSETKNWYSDEYTQPLDGNPWAFRGGSSNKTTNTAKDGIFRIDDGWGGAVTDRGFRIVLT